MKTSDSAYKFLIKTLGEDGLEELKKSSLYKLGVNRVIDINEIVSGMRVVPRTVLAFLQKELRQMKHGDSKNIELPLEKEATLRITKHTNDVYSGDIHRDGKILSKFLDRSIPGVGLIVMSTFELYDIEELAADPSSTNSSQSKPEFDEKKLQEIIEEKLELMNLISKVVDQKLNQKEAVESLLRLKLTHILEGSKKT